MSQRWLKVLQALVFLVVLFGSIFIARQAEYPLNAALPTVWAFMAAYGLGLANDWYERRVLKRGSLTDLGGEQEPRKRIGVTRRPRR